ncbi:hypothetical protein NM688_g891 [Phlebia brevispora]|uniref:Uncharacterized protein n=1 Tax=Phlebia brevispora TaxID=194682 RepID=A0ACC1TD27_9APHY|nr:hypothetical protein NM688_g891 [Phlebia brevispora]
MRTRLCASLEKEVLLFDVVVVDDFILLSLTISVSAMSSDEYFDDDLPSAILHEFDAIDAAYRTQASGSKPVSARPKTPPPRQPQTAKQAPREVIEVDDDDEFGAFDDIVVDDAALKAIDQACVEALAKDRPRSSFATGSSRQGISRTSSKATIQTTLFGGVATQSSPSKRTAAPSSSRSPLQRRASSSANNIFRGKPKKVKQWDHTAFAKTGWKQPKSAKGKETTVGSFEEEEEFDDEDIEFEQFPAPFVSVGPPPPMKLQIDRLAARCWIYPLNQPKRDYQYNIVKKSLYENTLVALPTGLGKTFIAGVVMLNFYTWFPEGKVVFVAPTKPLVAQQIDACHKTCGIPGSHAAELTGQNTRQVRAKAWQEKRVFYMTPQTLMNDLRMDNCDPSDIVLLVIDEAHKGSGDYAYAQVVRYLMAKNPHFRILALTATPGSKPETVQTIVDALHISHIEIRDEHSLDLKPYMHKKHTLQHVIPMNEDIIKIRDLLSVVMEPMIKKLSGAGILHTHPSPVMIHPFSCLQAMKGLHGRGGAPWAFPFLQKLNGLARAMSYLYECSMVQCYTCINELISAPPKGKQKENPFKSDVKIQAILEEFEAQKNRPTGFAIHPKMEKLKMLLVEHFAQKQFDKEDADAAGRGEGVSGDSRVMVFSTYRQCVDEIVEYLNRESPMIRAVPFIGQGTDKSGKKGYGQKQQLEVIKKFKAGEYNVLVSTSIGEEGLDIGEIDMIICYEAQKSSVRMLQRIGRTGRKRDGYVHVLMSEVREERNWEKANENYEDVQRFIIRAEDLELYGDVERLVPPEFDPEAILQEMPIEEYVRDDGPPKRIPKSPKSKKTRDPKRNIPTGAASGFVNASQLVRKGRLSPLQELDSDALNSDSDDQEIMAGIHGPRRTISMPEKSMSTRKKGLRRTATTATGKAKKTNGTKTSRKKKQALVEAADIQLEDDSDDEAIERGLHETGGSSSKAVSRAPTPPSPTPSTHRSMAERSWSPEIPLAEEVIDLTASDPPVQAIPPTAPSSPAPGPSDLFADDEVMASNEVQGSPASLQESLPEQALEVEDPNMAWLLDDDDESVGQVVDSSPLLLPVDDEERRSARASPLEPRFSLRGTPIAVESSDVEIVEDEPLPSPPPPPPPPADLFSDEPSVSPKQNSMPPPPLPNRFAIPSTPPLSTEPGVPCTFDVRGPGKGKKRARVAIDSSPLEMPSTPQKRLQRGRSPSRSNSPPKPLEREKPKRKKRKFHDIVEAKRHNPWMDVEAGHSGDEYSDGGSEGDYLANESDRRFMEELPETQASPSYDQSAVYRRSLITQASSASLPAFAHKPMRRDGGFVYAAPSNGHSPADPSSSPPYRQDSDDYMLGSFIVADDEDISYATDRSMPSDP